MRYAAWLAVLLFATTLTFAANDGVPMPMNPASLMGVSMIRLSPHLLHKPSVTL